METFPSFRVRILRWGLAAVLAAAASLSPVSLSPAGWSSALARPLDDVRASGSLRITVYRDFFPFSNGLGASLAGLDVDLGRILAQRLGVAAEFNPIGSGETVDDDLRNGVWRGPVTGGMVGDVMLHIPFDQTLDARTERAVLFAPYYRESLAVAAPDGVSALDDLDGQTIAVEIDSLPDLYLSGAFGGRFREALRRHMTFPEAAAAYRAGQTDALMGMRSQVEAERQGKGVVSRPPLPGLLLPSWPLGVAVREDSRDLGYAIAAIVEEMITDGSMAALFARHGLTYTRPE